MQHAAPGGQAFEQFSTQPKAAEETGAVAEGVKHKTCYCSQHYDKTNACRGCQSLFLGLQGA
jgi:hypothetical protein